MAEQIIEVFCEIDDFCIEYEKHMIPGEAPSTPKTKMALSEIMTIAVMYHLSHYREFKWYYKNLVSKETLPLFLTGMRPGEFVSILSVFLDTVFSHFA